MIYIKKRNSEEWQRIRKIKFWLFIGKNLVIRIILWKAIISLKAQKTSACFARDSPKWKSAPANASATT